MRSTNTLLLAVMAGFLLSCLLGCSTPRDPNKPLNSPLTLDAKLEQAEAAYQARDYATTERLTTEMLRSSGLSKWGIYAVRVLRANALSSQDRDAESLADLDVALTVAEGEGIGLVQFNRFHRLLDLKREAEAAAALLVVADYPEHVHDVRIRPVILLVQALRKAGRRDELLAVLLALDRAQYTGGRERPPSDYPALQLVRELVAHGDRLGTARDVARGLRQYSSMLSLHNLLEYAPLWRDPAFAEELALANLPARALAAAERDLAAHPREYWAAMRMVEALRIAGQAERSAEFGREALAHPERFDDDPEYRLWFVNELFTTLHRLGRDAEADALMRPLLELDPNSTTAVNQQINYGTLLMARGEHAAAIDAARRARPGSSVFGKRFIDGIEACGWARTGQRAKADARFDEMLREPKENYLAAIRTAACLGRLDDLERLVLARLADPDQREPMLRTFNGCIEERFERPLERELRVTVEDMQRRPAVVAAFASFGRPVVEPIGCQAD